MHFARSVCVPLVLVVLGAGWDTPKKPDSVSDLTLKDKGLIKTGTAYVIEDEKPVLVKMKEARTSFSAYAAMSGQQVQHEELAAHATQLEEQRGDLQAQLDDVTQRISDAATNPNNSGPPGGVGGMGGMRGMGGAGMGGGPGGQATVTPLTIERDRLKSVLAEVTAEQKKTRNQMPQAKDTASLDARVKKADETFKAILADLRKQVDEVVKKYVDLENDETVKSALAEAKKGNSKLHLGPSDSFVAGTKELSKAEQRFLGKRTTTAVAKKKAKAKK